MLKVHGHEPDMMEEELLKEDRTSLQLPILPAVSVAATLAAYVQEVRTPPTSMRVWFNVVEILTVELGRVELMR